MPSSRSLRHLIGRIAVLAVLLAALAPSISHALGLTQGLFGAAICSTAGSPAEPDGQGHSGGLHPLEHCPWCGQPLPVPGLPPAELALAVPRLATPAFPPAFWQAPRTLHAWVRAQPRAPPILA